MLSTGCNIAGGTAGVHFCYGDDRRLNGDAFAELETESDLTLALAKNKKHIGHRYIDGNLMIWYFMPLF